MSTSVEQGLTDIAMNEDMSSHKRYVDFMNEITSDELYRGLLAYGLFPEKLPPIFSSEKFFEYCQGLGKDKLRNLKYEPRNFIRYESMRNINTPRPLGIPHPIAYAMLCLCIADHWDKFCLHFKEKTKNHFHKISRIHIRKIHNKSCLFEMNYTNWKTDGSPEPDLLMGKRWLVKADISNCFPSIYTHSLPWALMGKENAKNNRGDKEWPNKIDKYAQKIKCGETHGLIIGPHVSNILSELILTSIDRDLYDKDWRYIRNIDDYSCYVSTYEEGQRFLVHLNQHLRDYDLSLNHKKTEILELPTAAVEQWVRQINSILIVSKFGKVDYKSARSYLDSAIELMHDNNMNAAVLNYAVQTLRHQKLTDNAKDYCVKTIMHLSIIYPYLIPLLYKSVFVPFSVSSENIEKFSIISYKEGQINNNFEAICFVIFFALKYGFEIPELDKNYQFIEGSKDCILALLAYQYFKIISKNEEACKSLENYAKTLLKNKVDYDGFWLFVYEVLTQNELHDGDFKDMKKQKVSFLNFT